MRHLKSAQEAATTTTVERPQMTTSSDTDVSRSNSPPAGHHLPAYWYVEEIRGVRVNESNDGLDYLVRWSGYNESYNSWEPEKNCVMAASKVRHFFARMPKDDRDFFVPRMTIRFLTRLDALLAEKKSGGTAGPVCSSGPDAI